MQTLSERCKTGVNGTNHHTGDVSQVIEADFVTLQTFPCSSSYHTNPLQGGSAVPLAPRVVKELHKESHILTFRPGVSWLSAVLGIIYQTTSLMDTCLH